MQQSRDLRKCSRIFVVVELQERDTVDRRVVELGGQKANYELLQGDR
jgi:hypothetical protein